MGSFSETSIDPVDLSLQKMSLDENIEELDANL